MNLKKSWCNISGMKMSSSKLFTLTLIISIIWTSGALADQKLKQSSLSEATAEKLTSNKLNNNRDIYIDNEDDFEGSGRKGEVHDALENENDDVDGSGSGGGYGDDEDDLPKSPKDKSHLKPDQNSNQLHHSGDGSDHRVDNENPDEDEEEYRPEENHEDHLRPVDKDIYFENSTPTDKPLNPSITDDEDIGGGSDTRRKDYEYPGNNKGSGSDPYDVGPTHHVPILPTDPNSAGGGNDVLIMNTSNEDRTTSFFAQPGILAAVIGGAVVGLLFAILVVMFIVYRMRKKDEGSYALDEPQKRSPQANSYTKNHNNREFYA